jgi:drug/metabolite transporter (DMT)-like permease
MNMARFGDRARPTTVQRRAGLLLALLAAAISGVAIFLNGSGVRAVPDAAVYTTLKNAVAAAILAFLWMARRRPTAELGRLDRSSALGLVVLAIIGGSVPFVLFFTGLSLATPVAAAFIQKTLVVWVSLLAAPLLGEGLGLLQVGALAVLLTGQVLLVPPGRAGWGMGETLVLAATLLWAVEVIVAKVVLRRVDPLMAGTARLGLGLIILVGYLGLNGRLAQLASLSPVAWGWILLTGVVLAGYVASWYAALARAPASVVTSVLVVGAVITAALQALSGGPLPGLTGLLGQVLLVAGAAGVVAAQGRPRLLALGREGN